MSVVDTPTTKSFVISFAATYGRVLLYEWFGEDNLLVGFEKGIIALISVKQESFGQEKFTIVVGPSGPIDAISISADQQKMAVAQNGSIKFYPTNEWIELVGERLEITKSAGRIT
jgi:hypothetical protein